MELTVIKPGKPLDDPEKNVRYFICDVCECEFKADKRDCRARHVSLPDLTTTYYICSCPNCKAICFGHIKSEYTRRKLVQLKEQEEKANRQVV